LAAEHGRLPSAQRPHRRSALPPRRRAKTLDEDGRVDLPGGPRIVRTPGHTAGHCSVYLEDRGVLFAGDAMVNFDYASGERGLKLHRFNEDREGAMASLSRFDGLDAEVVLFGHGDPWRSGLASALEIARERS